MQRESMEDLPVEWRNRQTPTVLVVDDTPDNLVLVSELLGEHYRVKVANSGARALKAAQTDPVPDLVLLDIMMPEMDGYEVCRQLKAAAATRDIPIIFLTARADRDDERLGLELGAVDYITKPMSPPIVLARVQTHLALKATADFLRDKSAYLEREVALRTLEVQALQDVTIMAMASLAERLRTHPRFEAVLNPQMIDLLYKSAPLHDIGKIGVPDHILLKPGKLTDNEFEVVKEHTLLGRKAIEGAERRLGMRVRFLNVAKDMACCHHERWDGTGYPLCLAGDAIPVPGRLMALADVYDAIISRRIYKSASTHEQACSAIVKGRGTQFDPDVVDAFIDIAEEFRDIALKYPD